MCTGNENCLDTSQIVIPAGDNGADGANGTNGTNGSNGADGIFGGFSAKWRFDATTGGAPAATFLKFDSTVLSTVSSITVNDLNADSTDHDNFLASFQNTINSLNQFGLVRIWKRLDSNTFWSGEITDTSDAGTSRTFAVTHIESNGTFATNDEVVLSFVPRGASAADDKEVLEAVIPGGTNSTITLTSLGSYTVPANTLTTDGDTLEGHINMIKFGTIPSAVQARVNIAADTLASSNWLLSQGVNVLKIDFKLTRVTSTTVFMDFKSWLVNSAGVMIPSYGGFKTIVFNTATTNVIDVLGLSADGLGNSIKLESLVIKKFDK